VFAERGLKVRDKLKSLLTKEQRGNVSVYQYITHHAGNTAYIMCSSGVKPHQLNSILMCHVAMVACQQANELLRTEKWFIMINTFHYLKNIRVFA